MARRKSRRQLLAREERVDPTPETLAKARGCILTRLYQAGQIEAPEHSAAVSIIEGLRLITAGLEAQSSSVVRIDGARHDPDWHPAQARLAELYMRWGAALWQRHRIPPSDVVEVIEMEAPLEAVGLDGLRQALRLWCREAAAYDREAA